jgi:hypothetical protein
MTSSYHGNYVIWIPNVKKAVERLNSDHEMFHGSGKTNPDPVIIFNEEGRSIGLEIRLAPFANMIFEVDFEGYAG